MLRKSLILTLEPILLHKEDNQGDYAIFIILLQKDPNKLWKKYRLLKTCIYRQLRNAEPPWWSSARGIIDKLFFPNQRWTIGRI
jgi:DNA-directed RNA polymerase subunit beta